MGRGWKTDRETERERDGKEGMKERKTDAGKWTVKSKCHGKRFKRDRERVRERERDRG